MANDDRDPRQGASDDAVVELAKGLGVILLALVFLPLVIPILVLWAFNDRIATKWRYWQVPRWGWILNVITLLGFAGILIWEIRSLSHLASSGALAEMFEQPDGWTGLLSLVASWGSLNLALGVLLLPLLWSLQRRRTASRVRLRHISDVVRQDQIEEARQVAADMKTAARIRVRVDPATREIVGVRPGCLYAPLEVDGRHAIGLVNEPTVRNVLEHFHDQRRVPDWIDKSNRYWLMPAKMSMTRALVLAESGSGKTELLNGMILAALDLGARVVFIDGKGVPDDAETIVARALARGKSAARAFLWNLFSGDATAITEKLMRLLPQADGAMQHYTDEQRGVLQAVQHDRPLTGIEDLADRLRNPERYVSDQTAADVVNKPVGKDETAGTRALQSLLVALNPLAPHLGAEGWAYEALPADLTVVSLTPVDAAQAKIGELMLTDLRNYLAARMRDRDHSPVLVVVDEFPQLVGATTDPSDEAAMLYETTRSVGVGLILAAQGVAGLSKDEVSRRRLLTSGAALIVGRTKDPEDVVKFAGTVLRLEATGAAMGDDLRAGRSQHTYALPPDWVRRAPQGKFWIIQGGATATARAMPTKPPEAVAAAPPAEAPTLASAWGEAAR